MKKRSKKIEKKDTSPHVEQRDKINISLNIKDLNWTERQKEIIATLRNKENKIIFLKGPAGSAKTMLSMYVALHLLNEKRVSEILMVRSAVESSENKLGFLPGDLMEKFGVYVTPFNDKIGELLDKQSIASLEKDKRLVVCPVNFVRGLSWNAKAIIVDEAQNMYPHELETLMTRMGQFSKMIICGDPDQSDLPINKIGGFLQIADLFDTPEDRAAGIVTITLTEEDIMRSELCRHIVKKFMALRKAKPKEKKRATAEPPSSELWTPGTAHEPAK